MSFIVPKKPQILYAPMLASFGGGSARGFNPGGGGGIAYTELDITINAAPENTSDGLGVAKGGTLAAYQNAATGNNDPSTTITGRIGDGILVVPAKAGTYNITARSSTGSGNYSAQAKELTGGTLLLTSDVTLLILVGQNGCGDYSGGGGTFIATANSEDNPTYTDMTSANAVLVLGGGAGGYNDFAAYQNPGGLTSNLTTAETRLGLSASTDYAGAAGFLNSYTPFSGQGYTAANIPHHFVQGGRGSLDTTGCSANLGGLGGGGGSCPAGGGGYVGGYPGDNDPAQRGGGGGTSYFNSNYISGTSENNPGQQSVTHGAFNASASGYVTITPQ